MSAPPDLKSLVKRVVGRVMAERGRERPVHAPGTARPAGVHVTIEREGGAVRPAQDESSAPARRGSVLISASDLAAVADGTVFAVPSGAIVTDLAREEAWRRRIRFEERATNERGRMKIAIGADHGGFKLKGELIDALRGVGHDVIDVGTRDESPVDYPDFARAVAELVARGDAHLGVVVDGAGIGSAMAANKVPGARAANCWDEATARNAREHNYANVLTLGSKHLGAEAARKVLKTFLATAEGEERHGRRVAKITEIERRATRG